MTPISPLALFILGVFFLTREIEISLALVANFEVFFTQDGPRVRWCLPATKTDPTAISVSREWGCLCASGPRTRCPAHVVVGHVAILVKYFGPRDQWPLDLPLFPDLAGGVVEKRRPSSSRSKRWL